MRQILVYMGVNDMSSRKTKSAQMPSDNVFGVHADTASRFRENCFDYGAAPAGFKPRWTLTHASLCLVVCIELILAAAAIDLSVKEHFL